MTPRVSKVLESIIGSWILDSVRSQFDDRQFGALTTTRAYYYYKCQDLSDATTTVAGALYIVYQ